MKTIIKVSTLLGLVAFFAYFLCLPIVVNPIAWHAPENPGYTGDFSVNHALAAVDVLELGPVHGPEDVVMDNAGNLYVSTHEGKIIQLKIDGKPELWADIGGRPLGLALDANQNLIVADAYQGLLMVTADKKVSVLTNSVNGQALVYANNVDIARDGKVYFSEASSRFGAQQYGGSYPASLLDLMEHGAYGRVLVYDPLDQSTQVLYSGLHFANGIALSHDEKAVLINETGSYRVMKLHLQGPKKGLIEPLISELPGFPDNLTRGLGGRYWLGLVSPRNPMLDSISDKPFLRKIVQRLPSFMRPKANRYSHVIAINDSGEVVSNLQDPEAAYAINTSVLETQDYLYIGSLMEDKLGRLANPFK